MAVKLAASIAALPNAKRHNIELAANAINASPVSIIVFAKGLIVIRLPWKNNA
jgi:hypothetical protein